MTTNNYILEIENLCVSIKGKELLHNINLKISEGEIHVLFGQNGSGKTSLMMAIMGFSDYKITQGQIKFMGEDISKLNVSERARLGIAISQQRPPTIQGVTLRNILSYILENERNTKEAVLRLAETANMTPFLDRSINDGLSGGEIKRAELVQIMAMSPKFLMLDEPDSGVDVENLSLVGGLINKIYTSDNEHPVKRKSGLIITHSGNILDYLNIDKAHVMHEGRIGCSGNPSLILETVDKCGYEECVRCIEGRMGENENQK